jgi:hypothetical protein
MTVRGYCVLYGEMSLPLFTREGQYGAREVMRAGCFTESILRRDPVYACLDHDKRRRLGGKLVLFPDGLGVGFELRGARLPRECTGVSVLFKPRRWVQTGELYELVEGTLRHVALLTRPNEPAYPCLGKYLEEECSPATP